MAHFARPLVQLPRFITRHRHSSLAALIHSPRAAAFLTTSRREVHVRSRAALKPRDFPPSSAVDVSDGEASDGGEERKSRNARKRDARKAVRLGMELASFSPPQIKRILRAADLGEEVFDALMLVKRLGRDVREGKRRQFSYIGRLLREVEPELMDGLIQATKEGDLSKFQDLSGTEIMVDEDEEGEEEEEDEDSEDDEEEDSMDIAVVTRWYDGLINKDISITNEIYSLHEVEFDRQELRQLVRKVQSTLQREAPLEENEKPDPASLNARKSLTRFLQGIAKQLPPE